MGLDPGRKKGVPGQQQVAVLAAEIVDDIREEFERQLGVEQRVVDLRPCEGGLVVLLDQAVVGILRTGKGTEVERVDGGEMQ